jgi:hypothetical protein
MPCPRTLPHQPLYGSLASLFSFRLPPRTTRKLILWMFGLPIQILTHSFSRVVLLALKKAHEQNKRIKVYVTEGRVRSPFPFSLHVLFPNFDSITQHPLHPFCSPSRSCSNVAWLRWS